MPPKHVSIPCCSSCSFKQSLISFAFSLRHFLSFSLALTLFFCALCVAYLWLSHFANGISFYDKWLVIIKVARSAVFGPAASNMQESPLAAAAAQWPQQQNAKETEGERECEWERVQKVNNVQQASLLLLLLLPAVCPAVLSCRLFSLLRLNDFCQVPAGCAGFLSRPAGNERQKKKKKQHTQKAQKKTKIIQIENCAPYRGSYLQLLLQGPCRHENFML